MMEAIGGLTALTGYEGGGPMRTGIAVVDALTSLNAAIAVMAALVSRSTTGRGQRIDVSHFESCTRILGEELVAFQATGVQPTARGNRALERFRLIDCFPQFLSYSAEYACRWRAL
jgi:crotonobetainyl-CoA:carnitine CoA-transferase CaiB-like acyl-CoA transferase